ncbi:MAG: endolytic transglycosylase MltG [Rickettsiales bacterium]|nr:endolytic transglycosylase MltG [Rickettsiales bacterium]
MKNKKPGAVVRRPPSARRKPVAKKKQIKRQAKKIIWRILAIFGLPLLVLSAVAYYFLFVYSVVPEPRPHVVPQGASVSRVAGDLGQGAAFKLVVMLNGNKVMAGTYDLPAGASVWRLARMLARGEVAGVSITIPEGLTVRQIVNLLNENRFLTGDAKHNYKDGDLFPDTYVVPKGTGRAATMDLMARKMEQIKNRYTDARASFLLPSPLKDWNEVMTLASIVQKETAKTREMPLVASVYLNRLRKKMRLQADPTVVYAITNGLGDMQERRLYEKHLRAASPYNTYRKVGLPPAPIANVGLDAIRAVLNPADTNYYYFVADGDGGHTFSRTLDEHNQKRSVWREIKFNNSKSGSQNPKSAIPEARRPAVAPRAR